MKDGNLTGFLEELFPDAVRCGVLTGLDSYRKGRVLLEDTQIKATDSLRHSLAVVLDMRREAGFDAVEQLHFQHFSTTYRAHVHPLVDISKLPLTDAASQFNAVALDLIVAC